MHCKYERYKTARTTLCKIVALAGRIPSRGSAKLFFQTPPYRKTCLIFVTRKAVFPAGGHRWSRYPLEMYIRKKSWTVRARHSESGSVVPFARVVFYFKNKIRIAVSGAKPFKL
jgi:hypothetical protein